MQIDVFSLLPGVFGPYLQESILGRAQAANLLAVTVHNIRDYATDRHHITDDVPYGGGGGMIMKPEPIFAAVETILGAPPQAPVILLTPQGRTFTQAVARELAQLPRFALLCGRYEGLDERVRMHLATEEISVGDYVLTGGELPALTIIDAVARLIPGVLGARWAADDDSHAAGLLEYPHYTRPPDFRGWTVPDVLLSGHHAEIERWRRRHALERTLRRRPDMLVAADLSAEDRRYLAEFEARAEEHELR